MILVQELLLLLQLIIFVIITPVHVYSWGVLVPSPRHAERRLVNPNRLKISLVFVSTVHTLAFSCKSKI